MNNSKKKFIWNAIGTIINSFLSLFLLMIVTRKNGVDSSGLFSQLFSFSLILQIVSNYGTRIYQVTDVKEQYSFNQYLSSKILTSVISLIIMCIYILINNYDSAFFIVGVNLMLLRIIETFSDVFYAQFQKEDRLDYVGLSLTIKSISYLAVFVIADVVTGNLIISTCLALFSAFMVFLFFDLTIIKKFNKIRFDFNFNIYNTSKYIFLYNFVTLFILNLPRFLTSNISLTELGYLGILMMIPTVISLLCQFILQPKIITITNLYHQQNKKKLKKEIRIVIIILSISCIFSSLLAITIGDKVLSLLYAIPFEKYKMTFVILILAGTFNSFSAVFSNVLVIARKMAIQLVLYLLVLLVGTIIIQLLSVKYGMNGIFIGFCFLMLFQFILFYFMYLLTLREMAKSEK